MKKNWGQIKSECINLGFDKATSYQKNPSLFVEAANRAINVIATTVKPVIRKTVILHNPGPGSPPYVPYDMEALTSEGGKAVFYDFTGDRPKLNGEPLADYRKDGRAILLLPRDISGNIEVWWKRYPAPIMQTTPDTYELELDYDVSALVPILMGFYVWLDDNADMATMYRNDFDQRRDELMASWTRPLITIRPDAKGWI